MATFCKLNGKYGGMEASDTRRLRQPEEKNDKLKRLPADSMLDHLMLKDS